MPRSALEELQHLKTLLAASESSASRRTSTSSEASPALVAAQVPIHMISMSVEGFASSQGS